MGRWRGRSPIKVEEVKWDPGKDPWGVNRSLREDF